MLLYIVITLLVIWLLKVWITGRGLVGMLPPSVPGLPLIGTSFSVEKLQKIHIELYELSKRYGNIFTVWQYGSPSVMVVSAELMEQVHKLAHNRMTQDHPFTAISAGGKSIIMGDADPEWKHLRQVTFKALKSYGSLLKDLESLIHSEVESFMEVLQDKEGSPIEPSGEICTTLGCIISTLMFGERLGRDHPDIKAMIGLANEQASLTAVGKDNTFNIIPWLHHLSRSIMKRMHSFLEKRDRLLDAYLQKYQSKSSGGLIELLIKAEEGGLSDDQIKADFVDFLVGGIGTTKSSSLAFILLLLHHGEELEKLQQEIDHVIGRSRPPMLSDQSEMPLLQAALLETLRFGVPVPLLARTSAADIEIHGYHIPANMQFFTNVWSVCHDENFWKDPHRWSPERFLDNEGQLVPSSHPYRRRVELVFGAGNRVCPGKHFAKARLFLLFATLLQRFDLRPDPSDPPPEIDPYKLTQAFVTLIPTFKVCFIPRD